MKKTLSIFFTILFIVFAIAFLVITILNIIFNNIPYQIAIILVLAMLLFGLTAWLLDYMSNNEKYNKKRNELSEKAYEIKKSNDSTPEDDSKNKNLEINILNIMKMHSEDIYSYYKLSRNLAISSFVFAVALSCGGLATILYSISQNNNIGVVGGVIAEFVSATGIFVFRLALKYLKRYHDTLHENERVMRSLAVVENVYCTLNNKDNDKKSFYDSEKSHIIKNELYKKIIETELKINLRETMLLASKDNDIDYKRIFGTEENNSNNSEEQNIEEDSTSNATQQDDEKT